MPIEIRELVIKATVAQEGEEPAGATSSSGDSMTSRKKK
jgi:hypothetical protein